MTLTPGGASATTGSCRFGFGIS